MGQYVPVYFWYKKEERGGSPYYRLGRGDKLDQRVSMYLKNQNNIVTAICLLGENSTLETELRCSWLFYDINFLSYDIIIPLFRYDRCRWSGVLIWKCDRPRNHGARKTYTSKRSNSSSYRITWTRCPSQVLSLTVVDCYQKVHKTFCSVNKTKKKYNEYVKMYSIIHHDKKNAKEKKPA